MVGGICPVRLKFARVHLLRVGAGGGVGKEFVARPAMDMLCSKNVLQPDLFLRIWGRKSTRKRMEKSLGDAERREVCD